jgi:hypothetical protein
VLANLFNKLEKTRLHKDDALADIVFDLIKDGKYIFLAKCSDFPTFYTFRAVIFNRMVEANISTTMKVTFYE